MNGPIDFSSNNVTGFEQFGGLNSYGVDVTFDKSLPKRPLTKATPNCIEDITIASCIAEKRLKRDDHHHVLIEAQSNDSFNDKSFPTTTPHSNNEDLCRTETATNKGKLITAFLKFVRLNG